MTIVHSQRDVLAAAQKEFLRKLARWDGIASSRDLGPQISQKDNSVRQSCKRRGFVTFDGHYWRITMAGRDFLRGTFYA